MQTCKPSQEVVDYILDWTGFINDETRATFEASSSPYIKDAADDLTQRIAAEAGLLLTMDQQKTLNETVAFALQYSVSLTDIASISSDIALNIQNEDDFIYSFMTVVSLRVADNLERLNVMQGGDPIAPEFHEIATGVEGVIRDGRVAVGIGSVEGQDSYQTVLTGSGMFGMYYPNNNKLVFQQTEGRRSIFDMLDRYKMMFAYIIHESVHIYQDLQKAENTCLTAESEAYEIGGKAELLLMKSVAPVFPELASSLLEEESADLEKFRIQNIIEGLQCMGYDQPIIDFETGYWQMKEETMNAWTEELGWELMGVGNGRARDIYTDLLRVRHAYILMWRAVNMTRKTIDKSDMDQNYLDDQTKLAQKNLTRNRNAFYRANHESHRGAIVAQNYLWSLGSFMVYERYADPPVPDGVAAEYLKSFDVIADALLYQHYEHDGIF